MEGIAQISPQLIPRGLASDDTEIRDPEGFDLLNRDIQKSYTMRYASKQDIITFSLEPHCSQPLDFPMKATREAGCQNKSGDRRHFVYPSVSYDSHTIPMILVGL